MKKGSFVRRKGSEEYYLVAGISTVDNVVTSYNLCKVGLTPDDFELADLVIRPVPKNIQDFEPVKLIFVRE